MGARLMTSMGDATAVEMTRDEPRADVEDGIAIAVKRGKAPPLDDGEVAHLIAVFAAQERMTGVAFGDESLHRMRPRGQVLLSVVTGFRGAPEPEGNRVSLHEVCPTQAARRRRGGQFGRSLAN